MAPTPSEKTASSAEVDAAPDDSPERLVVGERHGRVAALVVEPVSAEDPLSDLEAGSARRQADDEDHVAPTTVAFATSTVRRRGFAAKVVRIIRVLYSDVIASTASTAAAICPNQMPARLSRTMSLSPPCPGLPPSVLDPPVRSAVSRIGHADEHEQRPGRAAHRPQLHPLGAQRLWRAGARDDSSERRGAHDPCRPGLLSHVLDRVPREVDERVLERRPFAVELFQPEPVLGDELCDPHPARGR